MRAALIVAVVFGIGCNHTSLGVGADAGQPSSEASAPIGSAADTAPTLAVDSGGHGAVPPIDATLDQTSADLANPIDLATDSAPSISMDSGVEAPTRADGGQSCSSNGCTAEQNRPYEDCIYSRCDLPYQACLGPGYRSASYGGPCASWATCVAKCRCNDTVCREACGYPDWDCQSCVIDQVAPCVNGSGCVQPVCSGADAGIDAGRDAGPDVRTAGCAELAACCASVTVTISRLNCQNAYNGVVGNELACGRLLDVYRSAGLCN
jgi:hypothetical protein